jgi:hypothetical protein
MGAQFRAASDRTLSAGKRAESADPIGDARKLSAGGVTTTSAGNNLFAN